MPLKLHKPQKGTKEWDHPLNENFEAIESHAAALYQMFDSRNILHNWDFRSPVNQRRLAEYAGDGYAVDRWRLFGENASLRVKGSYITHTGGGTLGQFLEFPQQYSGLTVTASIFSRNRGTGDAHIAIVTHAGAAGIDWRVAGIAFIPPSENWQITSFTTILPNNITSLNFGISGANAVNDIQAVKLELGTVSTLANDPPMDLGRELAVCQRFALRPNISAHFSAHVFGVGGHPLGIWFLVPTPVTMRVAPSISNINDMLRLHHGQTGDILTGFRFVSELAHSAGVQIAAMKTNHNMPSATLAISPDAIFSADL